MSGNLPAGVTAVDIDRHMESPEECEECGGVYAEDGHETVGEDDFHKCHDCDAAWYLHDTKYCPYCGSDDIQNGRDCPNAGMDMHDLEQAEKAHRAEQRMEERRIQEALDE